MEEYAAKIAQLVLEQASEDQLLKRVKQYHDDKILVQALIDPSNIRHADVWDYVINHINAIVNRKMGNFANELIDIDDFVQNANIDVIKSVEKFNFNSSFLTWLFVIVSRSVNQTIRRGYAKKRSVLINSLDDTVLIPEDQQPEEKANVISLMDLVRQVLSNHRDKRLVEIFLLAEVEGRNTEEIGKIFHLHPSRIRALLAESRKFLQQDPSIRDWAVGFSSSSSIEYPEDEGHS
ncbi:MAG: hypothetical protein OHK0022_13640 [Roseiflexaceae bacterium]